MVRGQQPALLPHGFMQLQRGGNEQSLKGLQCHPQGGCCESATLSPLFLPTAAVSMWGVWGPCVRPDDGLWEEIQMNPEEDLLLILRACT